MNCPCYLYSLLLSIFYNILKLNVLYLNPLYQQKKRKKKHAMQQRLMNKQASVTFRKNPNSEQKTLRGKDGKRRRKMGLNNNRNLASFFPCFSFIFIYPSRYFLWIILLCFSLQLQGAKNVVCRTDSECTAFF